MKHFGEHLMIDAYGGDMKLLNDKQLIIRCLKELPPRIGMRILAEPKVVRAPATGGKDPGGWSGFVIIAESHISIHTFPKRGFMSADVYSCKNGMDVEFIKKYLKNKFKLKELETNFVKRGKKYPNK